MEFSSMDTEKDPSDRIFTTQSLNNDPDDYSKGRSLENLKKNPVYINFLKKADAKAFESIEESNKFHFKLMQAVADKLFLQKVHVDMDFIDNPENDFEIEMILACLYTLTGRFLSIPYKIEEDGVLSIMICEDDGKFVTRDSDDDE